jgi:hypothetical protein
VNQPLQSLQLWGPVFKGWRMGGVANAAMREASGEARVEARRLGIRSIAK